MSIPIEPVDPPSTSGGGGRTLWIVLLALLGVGAVVAVLVLVFGVGAAYWVSGTTDAVSPTDGGTVVSGDDDDTVEPAPPSEPTQPPPAGGRIVTPDGRAGVASVPTVIEYSDPVGGTIEIKGPGGFRAEWDGKAPFDLGALGEGSYPSTVTTAGGQKHRLKKFVVEPGKKSCRFTFDAARGEWAGGCE